MSTKNLITQEGLKKLKDELEHLIQVKRPEIIKQIQEAREQGDLSENADYDAAKNMQAIIEGRIKEIEEQISKSNIIDASSKRGGTDIVGIGCTVTYHDYQDDKDYTYTILGSSETDPSNMKISNECQLAKSILGKKVGETTTVKGVDDPYKVKVLKITYSN